LSVGHSQKLGDEKWEVEPLKPQKCLKVATSQQLKKCIKRGRLRREIGNLILTACEWAQRRVSGPPNRGSGTLSSWKGRSRTIC